jgi:hypothetical protein
MLLASLIRVSSHPLDCSAAQAAACACRRLQPARAAVQTEEKEGLAAPAGAPSGLPAPGPAPTVAAAARTGGLDKEIYGIAIPVRALHCRRLASWLHPQRPLLRQQGR